MPHSALAALTSAIADAHASAMPLRVEGSGTWLSAGRPVAATQALSTRELCGIIEYVPGDLVLTAHAGTTLGEIAHVTAQHGQWLALEPYASHDALDSGTIGATIATASHGPLALGAGRARDLILGLSVVTGNGTTVRAGGRVVKNVAGFDLVRLATGAWGTLGVIAQVSVRLHARPSIDETFAIAIDLPTEPEAHDRALAQLIARLNSAPLLATTFSLASLILLAHGAPTAVRAAHQLPDAPIVLLARATGNRTRVDAQRRALADIGPLSLVDTAVWRTIRTCDTGDTTLRITDAPLSSATTWRQADTWLAAHGATNVRTVLEPLRGAIRVSCASAVTPGASWSPPDRAIAERLPRGAWDAVPCAVNDRIAQRLREAFDPAGILNPGILGEASRVGAATTAR